MNQEEIVKRIVVEFPAPGGLFGGGVNVVDVVRRVVQLSKERAIDVQCSHCGQPFGTSQACTNVDGHRWIRADGLPLFEVRDSPPAVNAPDVPLFAVTNTVTGRVDAGDLFSDRRVAAKMAAAYNEAGHTGRY